MVFWKITAARVWQLCNGITTHKKKLIHLTKCGKITEKDRFQIERFDQWGLYATSQAHLLGLLRI